MRKPHCYTWLSAYVDDELSLPDRQRVEAQLATDPQWQDCYQKLLSLRQGFQYLQAQDLQACAQTPLPLPALRTLPQTDLWRTWQRWGWLGLSGLGLTATLLWHGRSSLWQTAQVQADAPDAAAVAVIPSRTAIPQPSPLTLVSSEGETGLQFALDQPILALPELPMEE